MKNTRYASKALGALAITIFLSVIVWRQETVLAALLPVPFIVCGAMTALRYVFLMREKPKAAGLCGKGYLVGFLLYWFGFLGYVSYRAMADQNDSFLILAVPMWGAGVYVAYKGFAKRG